jgi:chromosome segregation ATPase
LIFLFALCLGAGAALLYRQGSFGKQKQEWLGHINQLSNACHQASLQLDEQKLVNLSLERDLTTALESATAYSNKLSTMAAAGSVKTNLAVDIPKAENSHLDQTLLRMQEERDDLTVKLNDLTSALAKVDSELAETQRKLQASEGDREALLRQLKRLQSDRANLLLQFNDIALVREQLRKLKAEQSISRRLEWARRGVYGSSKGGELLRKGLASAPPASANYDLNVELRHDEAPKVLPPR